MKDFIIQMTKAAVVTFVAVLLTGMCYRWWFITFVDNVPVTVLVDGKQVYSGISGGVSAHSTGATTQVSIWGGPLFLFPEAFYVSHDVKIVGDKRR